MRSVGVGVIGMGWIGKAHSSAYINYRPNGTWLGYDDLKTLEVAHFLGKIFDKNYPYCADFQSAAKVAKVLGAIIKSNVLKKEVEIGENV